MNVNKMVRRWARPIRDFALGLGLYVVVAVSCMSGISSPLEIFGGSAHARLFEPASDVANLAALEPELGVDSGSTTHVQFATTTLIAPVMLALAFASLFSLNMWFARHLRLAYRRSDRRSLRVENTRRET